MLKSNLVFDFDAESFVEAENLFEDTTASIAADIENVLKEIDIKRQSYQLLDDKLKALDDADFQGPSAYYNYLDSIRNEGDLDKITKELESEEVDDEDEETPRANKEKAKEATKRMRDQVKTKIDELVQKAVKFLRTMFEVNDRRKDAAEKVKDAINKRKADKNASIRFRGAATYFVDTGGRPSLMTMQEIKGALEDADVDIDNVTTELYGHVDEPDEKAARESIRATIKSYFKQTSDVANAFAVIRPSVRGTAPLRLLFKEIDGKFVIATEVDQNVMARLKQNDDNWTMTDITRADAITLIDGAIECFNRVKLAETGIPTPTEKADMISRAENLNVAVMSVTAALRTTVAYSRYLGFLGNGAAWIAKAYHENRDNKGSEPV